MQDTASRRNTRIDLVNELDRQTENLIAKGYPAIAGLTPEALRALVAPLGDRLDAVPTGNDADAARLPFVLVVTSELIEIDEAVTRLEIRGKAGFTSMERDDIERFRPIDGLELPQSNAYLLLDVDTGRETLNVTPDEAMETIIAAGRSPLTLEEGVALVTQQPETLKTHNAFSMLGSRCGDRRVTALWVSAGKPRLGWCWAGNPHTWLGSASCAARVGV